MKKIPILLILFTAFACSTDEASDADNGLFYETHGGKVFAADDNSGYNAGSGSEDALYIPIQQPEDDGDPIINFWYRNNSGINYCDFSFRLGFNDADTMDSDCDIDVQIIEQTENKIVVSFVALQSYMSDDLTQEEFEDGECNYLDYIFTYEITDERLVWTYDSQVIEVDDEELGYPASLVLGHTLSEDWDVTDDCAPYVP